MLLLMYVSLSNSIGYGRGEHNENRTETYLQKFWGTSYNL